jgi:hypothetical protein
VARKARARDASYVERGERRKGWGWVRLVAGAGLLMLAPPAWVFLLNGLTHGFGEVLAQIWPAYAYSPAAGLPFAVIVTVIKIREHRNVDREGISLIVDEAGCYLGRARPRRIAWADIAEVKLIVHYIPPVRGDRPGATYYYVAFLLNGAKEKKNPMRWRPRKKCRDYQSLVAIEAAIRRCAPSVPVFMKMN